MQIYDSADIFLGLASGDSNLLWTCGTWECIFTDQMLFWMLNQCQINVTIHSSSVMRNVA